MTMADEQSNASPGSQSGGVSSGGHEPRRLHWHVLFSLGLASFGFVAVKAILGPLRLKLMTFYLSKEDYGALTLISLTLSFITVVSSLGSLEFILRRLPGRRDDYQVTAMRSIVLTFGAVAVAVAVLGGGVLSFVQVEKIALSGVDLVACGVLLVLTVFLTQSMHYLLGRSEYVRARILQLLYVDTWFLPIVALSVLGAISIGHVLWVWVGWSALSIILALMWVQLRLRERPVVSTACLREALVFGIPLLPVLVSEILFGLPDRYVLLEFKGLQAVADYSLCLNVAMIGSFVGGALLDILMTEFFKTGNRLGVRDISALAADGAMRSLFNIMLRYSLLVMIPFGAALALTGDHVLRFLSDPKFLDTVWLLRWTMPVPLLILLSTILGRPLLIVNKGWVVGWATLFAAACNFVLNMCLVPHWGVLGSAISITTSLAGLCLFLGAMLKVHLWVDAKQLFPVRLLTWALVTVACFAMADRYLHLPSGVVLIAAGVASGLGALVLGVVRRDDLLHFSSKR